MNNNNNLIMMLSLREHTNGNKALQIRRVKVEKDCESHVFLCVFMCVLSVFEMFMCF